MKTYLDRFAVFYIAVSNALKTLPVRDKEILAREAKEFLPYAEGDIEKLAIIIANPKTQTIREALTAFQEVLWETLILAAQSEEKSGAAPLAKLDSALKAYEAALEKGEGEEITFANQAGDLFSTIGEAIDEASAW